MGRTSYSDLDKARSAAADLFRDEFGEHNVALVERVGELEFIRSVLPNDNVGLVVIHPFPVREESRP